MQFFEFLDTTYQNKSYDNAKKYSIKRDGELQALHYLVNLERKFYKFCSIFKFIGEYFCVKLHLEDAPTNRVPKPTPTIKDQPPKLEIVDNNDPKPAA